MDKIKDLKILEFASVLAGPLAGNLFSELGAEVIKVENSRTGGDITRKWRTGSEDSSSAVSSYYAAANYKKEVVFADLRAKDDYAKVMILVEEADVIISNFKPATAKKLGVDFEELRHRNDTAVIAELVGYKSNPNRGVFDVLLQAETGYLSMTGHPGAPFAKIPVAMIDVLAAHQLRAGILAGLYQRVQDGKGRRVQVDLFGAALSGLINQGSAYLMNGDRSEPLGSAHPSIAPYGEVYYSSDQVPFILAVGTDAQFASLCDILDIDLEYTWRSNAGRVKDREKLTKTLSVELDKWNYAQLSNLLAAKSIPFAKIKDVGEALSAPESLDHVLTSSQEGRELKALQTVTFQVSEE